MSTVILSILLLLLMLPHSGAAQGPVTRKVPTQITWDYPTTNHDGSTLTDLGGAHLCVTFAPIPDTSDPEGWAATCVQAITVTEPTAAWNGAIDAPVNDTGTLYVRALAYDLSGNVSEYSPQAQANYANMPPGAILVINISVVIQLPQSQ